MQPLLKIQTQPIQVSFSSKRAQLRGAANRLPRYDMTRTKGRAEVRTDPARIRMDHTEMRASMGLKSAIRSVQEYAQAGRVQAKEAARAFVEEGNYIMDSHGQGAPIAEMARSKVMTTVETIMTFVPSTGPEMWVEGGTISFDYTMDQLDFDWHVNVRPDLQYEPGGVEFTVTQYPQVIIEYLGGPHYVPPSADPNYDPPPSLDQTA